MTTSYNFRLVATPTSSGIQKSETTKVREILTSFVRNSPSAEYYCFWGCYGEASQSTPSDKNNYVVIDGKYYTKETAFHTVSGYEKVRFEDAMDKTLYHPGGSNPAPGSNLPEDGDGEITTKERLTTIYTDESGKQSTKKWVPEDAIPIQAPPASNTFTFTAVEGETFIVYCGYDDNYGYQFAFQEIEGGVECPWTYEKRFNIFNAEYTTDYKQGANDYKLYAVSDEVNGVFPGTTMKSK